MAVDCQTRGEAFNQVRAAMPASQVRVLWMVNVEVENPAGGKLSNIMHFMPKNAAPDQKLEAMRACNPQTARHRIKLSRNTRTVNRTGKLTGYKLVPGSICLPLAGFSGYVCVWDHTCSSVGRVDGLAGDALRLYDYAGVCGMQPHGFFNCSPARMDVPPSTMRIGCQRLMMFKDNGKALDDEDQKKI
ncbi:hypothetical protein NC653_028446 [Populus alba x Populus x berolinensis]|uniref:Uncharacterized protein n=1 Tax=Populus alba x Populus x berolinensis TaxID=444605 RepID=A0AAD6M8K9_9ROSI|nr:hypothetical protein NC653_028446 [Populus alba x Populus x berolinensis]